MPSGSNVDLGDFLTTPGLSAGALNATLVLPTDVSNYKWISLYLGTSAYVGLLSPQFSFDQVTWRPLPMYPMTSLDAGDITTSTSATNIIMGAPVSAPFFQVVMSSYTSGTASGILQLQKNGPIGYQLSTTYARLLTAQNKIGYVNNDGQQNIAIAAGHVADTVVSGGGGMLARVLVTTVGTNTMLFYDNNAAPSGNVVGIIPASSPVNGVPFVFKAPCGTGIYAAGNSNNPGVTVFF